ncbi:putative dual-specificity RNA methyltransferase RlmN [Pseudomonas sp. THAF187a]|uniref:RNA methyltransferase n=2 Tax=Ectopseudomonas TaxID=3236654 RepID=A0ABW7M776_9GAMM|nr:MULTISPECIES: RNA methyltransferase [Pseudomonas]TNF16246.1 MAG: RNA methyltransferase [Pseudomonadales bacterium]CAE6926733.1 putative RNA methyltransferase Pmen_2155 [Pseudomonas oleovorans]QFT22308.1 putative dual-specificity RNA methyltransferase RlmN [Pseudomonas sp. THAF187a]QFT42495.1 putative dual-specificity RNA methyltransferase RlmN [Pseudomonas sp. THAF42]QTS84369.1 RNA methyltransferase [Pseudomonas khazarica]|tara:strand:- start:1585 stop:2625 length:1041 start_codon:yes stop_codon:yes gene_type:complete
MQLTELSRRLADLGAKPQHIGRITRAWLQGKPLDAGTKHQKTENFLPLTVREGLPAIAASLEQLARVSTEHPGADGSSRLLVELADRQMVESVLLPRDGLCISSQVGCAVGCTFCMTGKSGLLRQLSSAEMVAQVVLGRRRRAVKKVVFMGMGEPAHNLDNVLEAIDLLGTEGGIGHRNLVFSTVGDPRVFERLPQQRVRPALALSLHTTDAELRQRLLPRAPRIDPERLMELGEAYARTIDYPIQYQWTLLRGINDSQAELDNILRLFKGKFAVLNLIPYNSLEADEYQRPDGERIVEIVRYLHSRGVLTKVRNSAGQDVDGGCGQLRARAVDVVNTSRLHRSRA